MGFKEIQEFVKVTVGYRALPDRQRAAGAFKLYRALHLFYDIRG